MQQKSVGFNEPDNFKTAETSPSPVSISTTSSLERVS
jgi:hypothetical protein